MQNKQVDYQRRFKEIFDTFDFGVALMRQKLRRNNPGATPEQLELKLRNWLRARPVSSTGSPD